VDKQLSGVVVARWCCKNAMLHYRKLLLVLLLFLWILLDADAFDMSAFHSVSANSPSGCWDRSSVCCKRTTLVCATVGFL